MSGSDVWVCKYCRSVNPARAGKCYSCHTPREVAGARPEDLSVTHHEAPPAVSGTYRSSELQAALLTVATGALLIGTAIAVWILWNITNLRAAGESAAADQLLADRQLLLGDVPVLAALALLAYAAWISRVVSNLPALGGGYSRVSPRWAFFEPFIPGRNLYSLPARTAEVIRKLDEQARDHVLIGLAWLLVVAPLPVVAVASRALLLFGTGADLYHVVGILSPLVFLFEAAGLVIGLVVVWRVEGLQKARLAETAAPAANAQR